MNVDLGIWSKLTRVVVFLLLIAGLLGLALWFLPLIKQKERMLKENLRLEGKIQKANETHKQLKASIDALQTDPEAVERLAREKLSYGRPDEILVRYEEPATNSAVLH